MPVQDSPKFTKTSTSSGEGRRPGGTIGPSEGLREVDASDSGFGAVRKTPGQRMEEAYKILELEDKRHNNVKELLATEFALVHVVEKWKWKEISILVKIDNMTSMSEINKIAERIHLLTMKKKLW